MQAVILAAGKSSRFYPFTNYSHKSLIKVAGKPLIVHTILSLRKAGIYEMIIVVGEESKIPSVVKSENLDVSIKFVVQKEPLGMGNAVLLAREHIKGDFLLLNAHHVDVDLFFNDLMGIKDGADAVLLSEEREDAWKYGVLQVEGQKVLDLVEKPKKQDLSSHLCVVGVYLFSKMFIDTLAKIPSEHYQLETAISKFAKIRTVLMIKAKQKTITLKYPWDALLVKNYLLNNLKSHISSKAKVAKSAEIIGNVYIDNGATIMEGACIKGPSYVGKNAVVGTKAIIRNGVDVEQDCVIGATIEIKNSLLQDGTTTHSGFIGDSVIGRKCKIAAAFETANVRIDRKTIGVLVADEKIDSGLNSLGVIMGDEVRVGIRVSIMPGVVIGQNATIGPSTTVSRNIKEKVTYYTKFQEVVEEKRE
ncbi:MAG: NTP transferase domain-containing protein [Candidatus Levyibacteriota bacterium]|nr:MAG: NTP transferase domain-containing protein [Candidatus Levybacteria bacterium]